jgi:hypothetical protein
MIEVIPVQIKQKIMTPLLASLMLALSGCDQASQMAQQAASSAAGMVSAEIRKQSDGALEQIAGQANDVLQPLGIDANQIASSVKAKGVLLAQKALITDSSWQQLEQYQGQLPQDIGLFTAVSPISAELKNILNSEHPAFVSLMSSASALQSDGVLYVLGKAPADAKSGTAWLMIDTKNRTLEAGLIRNEIAQIFSSKGEPPLRPAAVQKFIQQYAAG